MDDTGVDLVDLTKLNTIFRPDCVEHRIIRSDRARGLRRTETTQSWTRVRELGTGGFSTVWLEKEAGGQLRAVKVIRKSKSGTEIPVQLREILAMAYFAKDDACFVQLDGWYHDDARIYIAMEYFELGDLDKFLLVPVMEIEAKEILLQITEALAFVHRKGFTHRDIKPQNVFVVQREPQWWVKLGDFGIAKRTLRNETSLHTAFTSAYLAPELVFMSLDADDDDDDSEESYTSAVDIWALGCLSYWLMTRTDPFSGPKALKKYCKTNEPNLVDLRSNGISQDYQDFINSCLTVVVKKRASADQLLLDKLLGSLLDRMAVAAGVEILPDPQDRRKEARDSRPLRGDNNRSSTILESQSSFSDQQVPNEDPPPYEDPKKPYRGFTGKTADEAASVGSNRFNYSDEKPHVPAARKEYEPQRKIDTAETSVPISGHQPLDTAQKERVPTLTKRFAGLFKKKRRQT